MATADRQDSSQDGYPKEIFKKCDDKYLCDFCNRVLREPVQSFCGHIFCKSCMEANMSSGCQKKCKQCEAEDQESDNFSIISQDQLNHHQQRECQTEKITCPVGCGEVERRNFSKHVRQKKHGECLVQGFIKVRQAPGGSQSTETVENLRQDVSHNTAAMNNKIAAPEGQIQQLQNTQNESENVIGQGEGNINTKIRQTVEAQLQGVNERQDVKTGTFEEIASALHRELEKTITAVEKLERHRREMENLQEQHSTKIRSLERSFALIDMTIAERELKAQCMEAASFDGTFMWSVLDFSNEHQDAIHGFNEKLEQHRTEMENLQAEKIAKLSRQIQRKLKTPKTELKGKGMIYQNGGKKVIDSFRPDPRSSSFKRPTSDMNIASGCPLFIPLEMQENTNNGFLKDDTMFLKFVVDTRNLTDLMFSFEEK